LHFGGRGYPVKNNPSVVVTHGEDRRQGYKITHTHKHMKKKKNIYISLYLYTSVH
jgi:hypothetical protein